MPSPTDAIKPIEVFKPGRHRATNGTDLTFSAADLAHLATAYSRSKGGAPCVVGHPKLDAPAYAWVDRFEFNAATGKLLAYPADVQPAFAAAVNSKAYPKVSLALFPPGDPNSPDPSGWYPRHVGFLGGAAPAIPGLADATFSGPADAVVEFAADFETPANWLGPLAGTLRSLRDWFIGAHGLETADRVVPDWNVGDLERLAASARADLTGFAAPITPTPEPPEAPPTVTTPTAPVTPPGGPTPEQLAARAAELDRKAAEFAARESRAVLAELEAEGKALPAEREFLAAFAASLDGDEVIAFAAPGATASNQRQALWDFLRARPAIVPQGEAAPDATAPDKAPTVAFAAPKGMEIDPAGAELHNKALAYQKQHPGTEYRAAVYAVTKEA